MKTLKHLLLIAIVLFSSCKAVNRTASPVIQVQEQSVHEELSASQAQEFAPLILGGKHINGHTIEEASSLERVTLSIDPEDPQKMSNLENVELLTNLRVLTIRESNLDAVDLSPLAFLTNLEMLFILETNFGSVDLGPLAFLTNLKRINILGTNLASVDFSPLSALSTLEDLVIEGDISRPLDLTSLEKLTWIIIKDSALDSLEGLRAPNVKRMEIEMETFDSLAPLSNLTKLEFLEISIMKENYFICIGNIKNISNLKYLSLNLWADGGTIDLTGINHLTSLKNLDIRGRNYKLVNSHEISLLHNLEYIFLELNDENPSIEYLRGLPDLRFVTFEGKGLLWDNETKEPHQILDVSPLGESSKLEQLNLKFFVIKNVLALNHLENLDSNAIWLNGCRLLDEAEAKKSTKWLIFDTSILKDG